LLRNTLKFLALSLVIIALASPITTKEVILDNSKGYEISLILDASGSMRKSNKFGIVKKILVDLRAKNLRVLRNNCLDFTRVFKFSLYGK
jgi:Ca-activated chloride channel family protein